MATQRAIIILLAAATLVTAIVAAYYWFKSAMIEVPTVDEPVASISDVPETHIQNAIVNMNNLRDAMDKSGAFNRKAAVWTGISALLGAATTISGIW